MTKSEFLDFIKENDVKFIRFTFTDMGGAQKNISVTASNVAAALSGAVTFDASAIFGEPADTRLNLHPDISTAVFLPWRPERGRVLRTFCEIKYADGAPYPRDTRAFLKRLSAKAGGSEITASAEFNLVTESGEPFDSGGLYDINPLDKCENIRREVCLALEQMNAAPALSHHGRAHGQNVVTFKKTEPLPAADNLLTLKSAVTAAAARNGLTALFTDCGYILQTAAGETYVKPAAVNPYLAVAEVLDAAAVKKYTSEHKAVSGKSAAKVAPTAKK